VSSHQNSCSCSFIISQYCIFCDFIKLYKLFFLGVACSSVVKMEEETVWDENEIFLEVTQFIDHCKFSVFNHNKLLIPSLTKMHSSSFIAK